MEQHLWASRQGTANWPVMRSQMEPTHSQSLLRRRTEVYKQLRLHMFCQIHVTHWPNLIPQARQIWMTMPLREPNWRSNWHLLPWLEQNVQTESSIHALVLQVLQQEITLACAMDLLIMAWVERHYLWLPLKTTTLVMLYFQESIHSLSRVQRLVHRLHRRRHLRGVWRALVSQLTFPSQRLSKRIMPIHTRIWHRLSRLQNSQLDQFVVKASCNTRARTSLDLTHRTLLQHCVGMTQILEVVHWLWRQITQIDCPLYQSEYTLSPSLLPHKTGVQVLMGRSRGLWPTHACH